DLDDRSEPGDRRADAGADERRLRDRRVAHTVLAEALAEPAGHAEDAADQTDVLAHDEDTLVALHLAVERLVEGLGHRDLAPAAPRGLADLEVGGVHGRLHQLHGGLGARLRELDRAVELELDRLLELLEPHRRRTRPLHQMVPEARDGVALHPLALLLLGPVL